MSVEYFSWSPLQFDDLRHRLFDIVRKYEDDFRRDTSTDAGEEDDRIATSSFRRSIHLSVRAWCDHFQIPRSSITQYDQTDVIGLTNSWSVNISIASPINDIFKVLLAESQGGTDRIYRPKVFETVSGEVLAWLRRKPADVDRIHHRSFEALCAEVLKSRGWSVELTKPTRDGGYDILGVQTDALGFTLKWVIECKLYDLGRAVGVPMVDRLMGVARRELADRAMLVTNSRFSRDAWERWETSVGRDLELVDREELFRWLSDDSRSQQ